jgi:hypothetical protein
MRILLTLFCLSALPLQAEFSVSIEGGGLWQTRNDVRIPSSSGTNFSLSAAQSGPFPTYRVYAGYQFNERHGLRLLFAPLSANVTGTYSQNLDFAGQTFLGGTSLSGTYQFNSYRLTYRYCFYLGEEWKWHIGFTGKIRDAKIALRQNALASESVNVGFVPLLHLAGSYRFAPDWHLIFDLDGLAAPQGRAFDATLQAAWTISPGYQISAGYRTVEGGAENSTVFNFTWLHYLVAAAQFEF